MTVYLSDHNRRRISALDVRCDTIDFRIAWADTGSSDAMCWSSIRLGEGPKPAHRAFHVRINPCGGGIPDLLDVIDPSFAIASCTVD